MSRLTKFGKAGRMPEVSRAEQIGKCKACGAFKRLTDLAGSVCAGPCQQVKVEVLEPEHVKPEYEKLCACDTCEKFFPESELQTGTCRECQELPL